MSRCMLLKSGIFIILRLKQRKRRLKRLVMHSWARSIRCRACWPLESFGRSGWETYDAQPRFLKYLEDKWLPCREEWADPWCKSILDLGNLVTSHVEGLHAKLKGYLQVSTGHLYNVLKHINILITNECQQFITGLSKCHVRHHYSHKHVVSFLLSRSSLPRI